MARRHVRPSQAKLMPLAKQQCPPAGQGDPATCGMQSTPHTVRPANKITPMNEPGSVSSDNL